MKEEKNQTHIDAFEKKLYMYHNIIGLISIVIFFYFIYNYTYIYNYISHFIDSRLSINSVSSEVVITMYKILLTISIVCMPFFFSDFILYKAYKKLDFMKNTLKEKKKKSSLYMSNI